MDLSFFTRRYVDRSKNTGFQFEFFCDKCNKGHLTPFRIHALGVVTSIWDATDWKKEKEKDFDFDTLKKDVSRLFFKGKAWIEAYTNAVEEAQKYFKHCSRCLKWVCPKTCFNAKANLCQGCVPLTDAERAAMKAEEKRKETVVKAPVDAVDAPRVCPHCGKSNPVATFCADCGQKVVQDIFCSGCGCKWSTDKKMKYCPRCGDEMPQFVPRGKAHVRPAEKSRQGEASKPATVKPAPAHQSEEDEANEIQGASNPMAGAKAKTPARKITKVSKVKRPTAQKKSAPAAKKRITKSNEPKGLSKPKAKKKPKPN